jgi:hypothetical protein
MSADSEVRSPAITGTLIHLSADHMVAFYVRDGACFAAEFREGRGEITELTTWFHFHAGPLRYCHSRRAAALDSTTVLTPEMIEKIEHLHRRLLAHATRKTDASESMVTGAWHDCVQIAAKIRDLFLRNLHRAN